MGLAPCNPQGLYQSCPGLVQVNTEKVAIFLFLQFAGTFCSIMLIGWFIFAKLDRPVDDDHHLCLFSRFLTLTSIYSPCSVCTLLGLHVAFPRCTIW